MGRRFQARAAVRLALLTASVAGGCLAACSTAAEAQFFWDQPRYSADDVARIAMQHGFRPLAQPMRNDSVYLADVVDQRGRRERLVINADSGEILQRFYLDYGQRRRRYADPTIPRGPVPPGMIPDENGSQVTRLSPDDGTNDRPQAFDPDEQQDRPPPRRMRHPRAAERDFGSVRPAPVESAPLAPPAQPPAALRPTPANPPAPVQASLPPTPSTPPATPATSLPPTAAEAKPSRPISRDPLAIPGSREQDQAASNKLKTEAAVPASKPAGPVRAAVPVAPLE
jgi:hypothetical protein